MSTITYAGGGKFAREKFVVQYNDDALLPSFAALGLPPIKPGANHTMVVCEEGTLLLQAVRQRGLGSLAFDETVEALRQRVAA